MPDAPEVLDLRLIDQLRQLLGTTAEATLRQLRQVFSEQARETCAEARAALRAGGGDRLTRAAHKLRGSCSQLGFRLASALALELEHSSRASRPDDAARRLERLEAEIERALLRLDELLGAEPRP